MNNCLFCGVVTANASFCSRSCSGKSAAPGLPVRLVRPTIIVICKFCHNPVAQPNNFCSRSCSASFNNSLRARPSIKWSCEGCGSNGFVRKSFSSRFCSNRCYRQKIERDAAERWLLGLIKFSDAGPVPGYIRRYIFHSQDGKCNSCGLSDWLGQGIALQLEHMDGDHKNMSRSNLCLLCPNCHALRPTSGSRNKGRGRSHRGAYDKVKNEALRKASLKLKNTPS